MKKAKRMLAVILTAVMLCGCAATGVWAKEPAAPTGAEMAQLQAVLPKILPLAMLEIVTGQVPQWLNWTVFKKGSSSAVMQEELKATLKKNGADYSKIEAMLLSGDLAQFSDAGNVKLILKAADVLAEKGPAIYKKHYQAYIGWLLDMMLWTNSIVSPVFITLGA
jgi:hypothetical protein